MLNIELIFAFCPTEKTLHVFEDICNSEVLSRAHRIKFGFWQNTLPITSKKYCFYGNLEQIGSLKLHMWSTIFNSMNLMMQYFLN